MTDAELDIRRVVVTIDGGEGSASDVELAAGMAVALSIELHGRYVEDEELLRAAALPVTRCFVPSSPVAMRLEPAQIEAVWRRHAERAKTTLSGIAQRHRLPWSFAVVRARPQVEAHELMFLARRSRASRWQADRGPVRVLDDGSPQSRRAMAFAARLARGRRRASGPQAKGSTATRDVEVWSEAPASIITLDELAARLRARPGGVLLIPATHPLVDRLNGLGLARLPCAIVIVG